MTGLEGNSKFCFSRISMFYETKSRETLRFEGNKIHCSPRDQSLSDLLYSKTKTKANFEKRAEIPAATSGHLWSRATAVNISRVTVNCFPFNVIVFAMLPAHSPLSHGSHIGYDVCTLGMKSRRCVSNLRFAANHAQLRPFQCALMCPCAQNNRSKGTLGITFYRFSVDKYA